MDKVRWQFCAERSIATTMHSNCRIKAFLALAALLISGLELRYLQGASKAPVRAKQGMVASSEKLASQIGIDTLKKGGNAVDAAVAVGFALAVTHPTAGNLGGGGFMMIRFASGETACIDYRETAPAAAGRDVYLDMVGQVVPKASTQGYRASGVPGTPAGLCLAQKKYGRLSLKEVIQPAIDLAEQGFLVSDHLSDSLKGAAPLLELFPESRRVYLNGGRYFEPGARLIQKDLASSLKAIRDEGEDGFYRGEVAAKIAAAYERHERWMTLVDLQQYQARLRTPLRGRYRGYDVITMPPPSSGGTVLLEMLNALEGFNVSSMGAGSSRTIHLMTEAMRHAFRDRAELMGDTDFVKVPTGQLVLKSYASEFRKGFNPEKALDSLALPARMLPASEASETTHFSVVDKDGNAVANTYTLNGGYGSGVTIEGTGILMNNEMDDFTSKPGVPNANGLIQGEANAVARGKRPLSAMTPTFLLREGKLFLVIGSPGGPTIINTVLQVIVNVVDFGFTIQEAIDGPRFHHQWLPDELRMENQGFSEDVTKALEVRGHRLAFRGFMGDAQGIMLEPKTGMRLGASDPRGDGLTIGY